jgi:hypothetical protein
MTMKTKTGMRILFAVAAVMMAAIGIVMGIDNGGAESEPGAPLLVAHAAGDLLTVENVGTAMSLDFGGAKVMVGSERVGLFPYTVVLNGNPFTFGKYAHPPVSWSKTVKLTRALVAGEKFTVTNGVGIYARGVAQ